MKIVDKLYSAIKPVLISGYLNISRAAQKNRILASALVNLAKLYDRIACKGNIAKNIRQIAKTNLDGDDRAEVEKTVDEIWKCRELYLIDPEEYFLFGFPDKSDAERRSYVGNREKHMLCSRLNKDEAWRIFSDKWQAYQLFRQYYKREAFSISDEKMLESFYSFCDQHGEAIVKDPTSSLGRGVFVADTRREGSVEAAAKEIRRILREGRKAVVEEKITQNSIMADFNPSSVNTLRIATFMTDEDLLFLFAFLRFGRKDMFVDNGGSGGLFASVDLESGKCNSQYFDKLGNQFQLHPDTNKPILGFQVPQWEDVLSLTRELTKVIPNQRYVGWDLAYSDKGWVMVEGNSRAQMCSTQVCQNKGLRPVIDKTFERYK